MVFERGGNCVVIHSRRAMLVSRYLSLIGNNLANLNSAGYKRDEAVQSSFAEWMLIQTGGVRRAPAAARPQGLAAVGSAAHSVAVAESYTSFAPGNLTYTGRSLDLALEGEAFFQVETAEGFLYTRDGRFFIDSEGYLSTAAGYRVRGEGGPLLLGTEEVDIHPDGSIMPGKRRGACGWLSLPPARSRLRLGITFPV